MDRPDSGRTRGGPGLSGTAARDEPSQGRHLNAPMFSTSDTIVAIATPPGRGGLGVVRLSGPTSLEVARRLTGAAAALEPRRATLSRILSGDRPIDHAIVTSFPAPHSYTGEDVVEVSAHGSPVLLRAIVTAAMAAGARLARPGEFTLRAYLNGRLDLVQAEAIRDLVDAVTPPQARAAFDQLEGTLTARIHGIDAMLLEVLTRLEASLDFGEEGYHFLEPGAARVRIQRTIGAIDDLLGDSARGRLLREGAQVAIVGRPNAGKSSLFNMLAGAGRAIVTDVPGTTRDLVTEVVEIGGMPLTLVDTAGLRDDTADPVEAEGIARAESALGVADALIVVLDRSAPLAPPDERLLARTASTPRVVVASKSDLPAAWGLESLPVQAIAVSAVDGGGGGSLRDALLAVLSGTESGRDTPAVTNARHADLLSKAREALCRAGAAVDAGAPEEFVASDLYEARLLLEEVVGTRAPDDVLANIFATFCIGK